MFIFTDIKIYTTQWRFDPLYHIRETVLRVFKNFKYILVGMHGVHKQTIQQEYFGHL